MSRHSVFIRFSAALVLALALALLRTLSAQAQDEPPPPEAPAAPPAAPAAANPGAGDVTGQDPAPPPLATADLQLYSGPDPWFVCSGAEPPGDPNPGNGRCEYIGAGTLTTAIAEFAVRGGSGLITCEDGAYTASPLINAIPMLTGIVSVNGSGATSISGRVEITGQTGGFILRGFAIGTGTNSTSPLLWMYHNSGAVKLTDITLNDNASGPGLEIENHTGSVTLERVQVDNNAAIAARTFIARIITNTAATGNITITNSSFDNNLSPAVDGGITLILYSIAGKLSMNGVSVSNNNVGDGMLIFAAKGITIKNSHVNYNGDGVANAFGNGIRLLTDSAGSLSFENIIVKNNENYGLMLRIHGAVTIRNAEALLNGFGGIDVDNCYFDGISCNPGGSFGVSLYNAYLFDNGNTGLFIQSNGSILLDGVRSLDSGFQNAVIYSHMASSPKPVTILRSSFDDSDNATGVWILTRGKVTLNNVSASRNLGPGHNGLQIDNTYQPGASVTILGSYGYNSFSGNGGSGLVISTTGSISIQKANASTNGADGFDLTGTGGAYPRSVSLTSIGCSLNGTGSGILVESTGAISLNDVGCMANINNFGAMLDNTFAPAGSYPGVTVRASTFGNNHTGLYVGSLGSILVTDLTSYGNMGASGGADLDNCQGIVCIGKGGVTVRNAEIFSNPNGTGLRIQSGGAISLNTVYSSDNLRGVEAYNHLSLGSPGVSMSTTAFVSNTGGAGGTVLTKGAVTLLTVGGSANAGNGLAVQVLGDKSITLGTIGGIRNYFTNNTGTGLILETDGAISVRGIYSGNPAPGAEGVALINNHSTGTPGITIRDVETSDNNGRGLVVMSHGTISAYGIVAENNVTSGAGNDYAVLLDNCDYVGGVCTYAGPARNVNLYAQGSIDTRVYNNNKSGLGIFTLGSIVVQDTSVSTNNGTAQPGAMLFVWNSSGTVTVRNSEFSGNDRTGLRILAPGNITLSGVNANKNASPGSFGIHINTSGNVSLTNITASGNFLSNISIICFNGTVTLRSVVADESLNGYGVDINNSGGTAKPVGLNKVSADANHDDNIHIVSAGAITASGITCSNSVTGKGCYLKNTGGTAGITINSGSGANNANGNAEEGVWMDTYGAITITGLTASSNHAIGIQNAGVGSTAAAAGLIKLDKVRAEGNWADGIRVKSNTTPIRISNSIVMGNTFSGINATFAPAFGNQLIVKNTLFFGNDRINAGNPNIQVTNGIVVIQ